MSLDNLKTSADGARIYLVPVGPVFGCDNAVAVGNGGLMFSGFRVLARDAKSVMCDSYVPAADIAAVHLCPELQKQAEVQLENLQMQHAPLTLAGGVFLAYTKPLIMGVLNVTPDSFSDGGRFFDPEIAVARARTMVAEGADIIDIGGESTRPGADPVWEGDEAKRVVPVIEALRQDGIPLSIDTRHSLVMEKAVEAGAHIINDVTALTYDLESLAVAVQSRVPIILMHSQGEPKTMQENPRYSNTLLDVYDYLQGRIEACVAAGIPRTRLIVDPGIGFGKRMVQDNMALINGLPLLHTLGCPVLFGASRKSFIGAVSGEDDPGKRLPGSLVAAAKAVELGAHIVRVHDVAETRQALKMVQAFKDTAVVDAVRYKS